MKDFKIISRAECPIKKALDVIGGKWELLILYQFIEGKPIRYGELKKRLPDISEKILIQQLKKLVIFDLLTKISYPEIPPKVEYCLTERGMQAIPVINTLAAFGMQYMKG